jgi:hypothetical protein
MKDVCFEITEQMMNPIRLHSEDAMNAASGGEVLNTQPRLILGSSTMAESLVDAFVDCDFRPLDSAFTHNGVALLKSFLYPTATSM